MPGQFQNLIPVETRSFFVGGSGDTGQVGGINTAVVNFDRRAVIWGTRYPIGTLNAPAGPSSGIWANVVFDAQYGTTVKFTTRGIYRFDVYMPIPTEPETPVIPTAALILDASAASMLATAAIIPTVVNAQGQHGVIGMGRTNQLADSGISFGGTIAITDTLAGGAVPQAVAGATGLGVVRLHLNNGAGGTFAQPNENLGMWCNYSGDLAG